jgi:hypothetical protein
MRWRSEMEAKAQQETLGVQVKGKSPAVVFHT